MFAFYKPGGGLSLCCLHCREHNADAFDALGLQRIVVRCLDFCVGQLVETERALVVVLSDGPVRVQQQLERRLPRGLLCFHFLQRGFQLEAQGVSQAQGRVRDGEVELQRSQERGDCGGVVANSEL